MIAILIIVLVFVAAFIFWRNTGFLFGPPLW
jgi:hypothetical protein